MNRTQLETWVKAEGAQLYATFDESERTVMRIGMLPFAKTQELEQRLHKEFAQQEGRPPTPNERVDIGRWLAVGCMDAANSGPDKMVV